MEAEVIAQHLLSDVCVHVGQRSTNTSPIKKCHTHKGPSQNPPFHRDSCIGTYELGIRTNAENVGRITDSQIIYEITSGRASQILLDIRNMAVVKIENSCSGSSLMQMHRNEKSQIGILDGFGNCTNDLTKQLSVSSGLIAVEFQNRVKSFQERFRLYGDTKDELMENYVADYDVKVGYIPNIFFDSIPNVQTVARESLRVYENLIDSGDLPEHYPASVANLLKVIKQSIAVRRGDLQSAELEGACMSKYVADFISYTIFPLLVSCAISSALGDLTRFHHALQEYQHRGRRAPNGDSVLSEIVRGETICSEAWSSNRILDVGSVLENLCKQWYKTVILPVRESVGVSQTSTTEIS